MHSIDALRIENARPRTPPRSRIWLPGLVPA